MYAVVDDRNQQYRVQAGDRIQIHLRKGAAEGDVLTFDKVCLVGGEGVGKIGTPFLSGASVTAKVVSQYRGPKGVAFKFKRRKGFHKKIGFRRSLTTLEVTSIAG